MNKSNVNTLNELAPGTLLWIYASNKKVYHSSKRFDTVDFAEHESNYLGELKDNFPVKHPKYSTILELLKKSDRVFGICLNDHNGQAVQRKGTKKVDIKFFGSWDKMQKFAEDYFEKYDLLEEKRIEEETRRKKARNQWLERGKRFLRTEKVSPNET